jgi:hypothetical protein
MVLFIRTLSLFLLLAKPEISFKNDIQETKTWINKVYKEGIKSVVIYRKGSELSFPVIKLDKDDQLLMQFDEIGTVVNDYSFSIVHCNSNWQQSDLNAIEYIDSYQEVDISDYSFSQNTLVNYVNYTVKFPSDDFQITKSGNYVIKVYERNNPENIILTRRFYVMEEMVEINASVDRMNVKVKDGLNQRINIELTCDYEIENPSETILLKVQKNNGLVKDFTNIKPSFVDGNILEYKVINELAFAGGNEFRHFDIKNFRFISDRLLTVDKKPDINHVYLRPDESRAEKEYNFKPDINGKRTIKLENSDRSNIMADYCFVYFRLNAPIPLQNGDYYIYGALTDWDYPEEAKMKYDFKNECFVGKLYLKQGYYNYQYRFKSSDKLFNNEESAYDAEGNFFKADNEYQILVYYKDYSSSYEKLVGYSMVNSSKSANY